MAADVKHYIAVANGMDAGPPAGQMLVEETDDGVVSIPTLGRYGIVEKAVPQSVENMK
jgi:aminoglycoside/choline kinase family phosphotransferase